MNKPLSHDSVWEKQPRIRKQTRKYIDKLSLNTVQGKSTKRKKLDRKYINKTLSHAWNLY